MSGIKLRLNEVKDKFGKFNQVIVIKLKAQWLSGIKLRLNDLFDTYSTVRGWTDEAKIIQFSTSCHFQKMSILKIMCKIDRE